MFCNCLFPFKIVIYKIELLKSFIDDAVSLVFSPISDIVDPLNFLSRYLPARIIGPPIAQVTEKLFILRKMYRHVNLL